MATVHVFWEDFEVHKTACMSSLDDQLAQAVERRAQELEKYAQGFKRELESLWKAFQEMRLLLRRNVGRFLHDRASLDHGHLLHSVLSVWKEVAAREGEAKEARREVLEARKQRQAQFLAALGHDAAATSGQAFRAWCEHFRGYKEELRRTRRRAQVVAKLTGEVQAMVGVLLSAWRGELERGKEERKRASQAEKAQRQAQVCAMFAQDASSRLSSTFRAWLRHVADRREERRKEHAKARLIAKFANDASALGAALLAAWRSISLAGKREREAVKRRQAKVLATLARDAEGNLSALWRAWQAHWTASKQELEAKRRKQAQLLGSLAQGSAAVLHLAIREWTGEVRQSQEEKRRAKQEADTEREQRKARVLAALAQGDGSLLRWTLRAWCDHFAKQREEARRERRKAQVIAKLASDGQALTAMLLAAWQQHLVGQKEQKKYREERKKQMFQLIAQDMRGGLESCFRSWREFRNIARKQARVLAALSADTEAALRTPFRAWVQDCATQKEQKKYREERKKQMFQLIAQDIRGGLEICFRGWREFRNIARKQARVLAALSADTEAALWTPFRAWAQDCAAQKEQRKREAAAAQEQRKREAAAAQEQRKREASAVREERKRQVLQLIARDSKGGVESCFRSWCEFRHIARNEVLASTLCSRWSEEEETRARQRAQKFAAIERDLQADIHTAFRLWQACLIRLKEESELLWRAEKKRQKELARERRKTQIIEAFRACGLNAAFRAWAALPEQRREEEKRRLERKEQLLLALGRDAEGTLFSAFKAWVEFLREESLAEEARKLQDQAVTALGRAKEAAMRRKLAAMQQQESSAKDLLAVVIAKWAALACTERAERALQDAQSKVTEQSPGRRLRLGPIQVSLNGPRQKKSPPDK